MSDAVFFLCLFSINTRFMRNKAVIMGRFSENLCKFADAIIVCV